MMATVARRQYVGPVSRSRTKVFRGGDGFLEGSLLPYIQRASLLTAAVAVALALPGCAQASTDTAAREEERSPGSSAAGGDEKVATIGDKAITGAELDEYMKSSNLNALREYFNARKQALENLINRRLLEEEAARQGITMEELQQKLLATASPVTDADVEKFYNDNKARMGQNSLDAMRGRIRQYLENQNQQQALSSFLQEQRVLKEVAVHIEPFRVEIAVAEHDATRGPTSAPVTIVEFSDFQ